MAEDIPNIFCAQLLWLTPWTKCILWVSSHYSRKEWRFQGCILDLRVNQLTALFHFHGDFLPKNGIHRLLSCCWYSEGQLVSWVKTLILEWGEYNMIRGGARISPTAGQPSPTWNKKQCKLLKHIQILHFFPYLKVPTGGVEPPVPRLATPLDMMSGCDPIWPAWDM